MTVAAETKARLQKAGSLVTVTLGCVHVTGPPLLLYTQYPALMLYFISSPCSVWLPSTQDQEALESDIK